MNNLTKEKVIKHIELIKGIAYKLSYSGGQPLIGMEILSEFETVSRNRVDELYNLTLSLLIKVYGENSPHVKDYQTQLADYLNPRITAEYETVLYIIIGKLDFLKTEIKLDLLTTFEKKISGEVYADFLQMARGAISEGAKDTAAVLACAALEDAIKRISKINGLETNGKGMAETSNALKSKGLVKGAQVRLIDTYIKVRNSAFHADWNKIDTSTVNSLIGFTESFVLENF